MAAAADRSRVGALLVAWLAAAPIAVAQRIDVTPSDDVIVAGTPLHIVVRDLAPGASVMLRVSRSARDVLGQRRRFMSQAQFTGDADGRIDVATQAPHYGGYEGADGSGLFWSMRDAGPAGPAIGEVVIEALADDGQRLLASRSLTLRPAVEAVHWRKATPLAGARLALGAGGGRRPAVIVLGGSEGGAPLGWAALLAAHGPFAALALPYYAPPRFDAAGRPLPGEPAGLPDAFAEIPIERLEQARSWLASQGDIDGGRICIAGVSKGAEFALVAASKLDWPACVVAIAATDSVWEGWGPGIEADERSSFSWQGRPLPWLPYEGFAEELAGLARGEVILRRPHDAGREAHGERLAAARIAVESYRGPLLVAGSHGDQVWDSGTMTENVIERRRLAALATVGLVFRDAGHALIGTGWEPTTIYEQSPFKLGGTPAANAHAQAEVFAATLHFLTAALAGGGEITRPAQTPSRAASQSHSGLAASSKASIADK